MKRTITRVLLIVVMLTGALSYGQNKQTKFIDNQNVPKFELLTEEYSVADSKQLLEQRLKLSNDDDVILVKSFSDNIGFNHTKYQQTYKGIPVTFGYYYIHAKNNAIKSFNGDFFSVEDLDVTPTLTPEIAFQKALNFVDAQTYMWENSVEAAFMSYVKPKGELVILPDLSYKNSKRQPNPKLAYRFDIYATQPLSRAMIYIDAKTGDFLYEDSIIHHADNGTAATRYSGSKTIQTGSFNGSYRLRDNSRGNGIETYDMNTGTNYNSAVDFTDNDNNWTAAEYNNAQKDNAALDAHYGAQKTYDYWMTKHNRNSYDGNGAKIKSYVHYASNYDNAFWNGSVMTYGDGSGTYFDALTSVDVAAHEIGHAVMTHTANLTYSYESGAMNEGFSDIWGASVENYSDPNKQTWLIGEDIERRSGHQALRSMSNPKSEGQPDTYKGTNWAYGSGDNGGVHTNSGVLNHWYYLVSVGGSGSNDNGDSYSVSGISINNAAKVAYRMQSVYLTSSSQYADARIAGIQSAKDLFGAGSTAEIAVTNAWYAVGIGAAYDGGGGGSEYCTSKGNNVSDEYIGRVQLNTINNASGSGNGYSDHTSISTDLSKDSDYTITVTPTWTGTIYNEAYAVWIDYNQDGDFGDSGELVWSKAASKATPVSGSFTVPSGALEGDTRMRVSMKYNGIPTACETFTYGEVEDYTVHITGGGSGGGCEATTLTINFDNYPEETSWTVKDSSGNTVFSGGTYGSQADGSTLNIPMCIDPGCYTFTIYDSYGDGICCGYGNGSYSFSKDSGGTIASGGSFNSSDATDFCISSNFGFTVNSSTSTTILEDVVLFPNPVTNFLSFQLRDQRMESFSISNMMGQKLLSGKVSDATIDVTQLEPGVYSIEFKSDKKTLSNKFIKK